MYSTVRNAFVAPITRTTDHFGNLVPSKTQGSKIGFGKPAAQGGNSRFRDFSGFYRRAVHRFSASTGSYETYATIPEPPRDSASRPPAHPTARHEAPV